VLIITTKGTTKERETNYSSRMLAMNPESPATPLHVVSGSEACSSITAALHELFDPTGNQAPPPDDPGNPTTGAPPACVCAHRPNVKLKPLGEGKPAEY
jgi:hypothetical protein